MWLIDHLILYCGLTLELVLLWRVTKARLFQHYPFFSTYYLYVFVRSVVLFLLFVLHRQAYVTAYWPSNLGGTALWFAVVWEVFRQTFPRSFPLRQVAAGIFVGVLVILASAFFALGPPPGVYMIHDFMRKVGLSVAASLLTILAVARCYRVSLGRNIWGMAIGLLALTSTYIADFAAIDLSPAIRPIWSRVGPLAFVLMLLIWVVTLWSYYPNPKPVASDASAHEQALSSWEKRWASVGTTIRRAVKP